MGELRQPTYTVKVTDPETGEVRRERRQSNVWWLRYYRNGKRHEESSGTTKKTEALRLLRLREGAVAKGEPVTAKVGRVTFDEAAQAVVTDYRVNKKKTLAQVERRIRLHLEPYFGGRRLSSITKDDAMAYAEHRQKEGAANGTINRELTILKRAFNLAVESGKAMHKPTIKMLHEDNIRTGFFERADFEAVRENLPEHLRGLVTFLYLTGVRLGEALSLQWRQVDREAKSVRLDPGSVTKSRDGRVLPYGALPELEAVLEAAWKQHQELAKEGTLCPFVFHRQGERIGSFYKAWRTACRDAGIPGRIVHDFRRTALRNLVRAGVPEAVAMKISGHKTRSAFERYNIVDERDLEDALGALAGKEKGKTEGSGRVVPFVSD